MRKLIRKLFADPFDRKLSPLVRPAVSAEPAEWLASRLLPWSAEMGARVCSIVPIGFEAYTRILHPAVSPPPDRISVRWSTIASWAGRIVHPEVQWEYIVVPRHPPNDEPPWREDPRVGECPPDVATPLYERLAEHTRSALTIWYAMWLGFPDVLAVAKRAPRFALPGREYALFQGPLIPVTDVITSPQRLRATPSIWWPADRTWCVATEVDFNWTYVGGTESCIRSIELDSRLETLRTEPEHRCDPDSDRVNI